MKKLKNCAIIKYSESKFNMVFKTRVSRIVASSIICFCFGIGFATSGLFVLHTFENRRGVGGFESSAMPVYDDNLSELNALLSEVQLETSDVVASSVTSTETLPVTSLTYQTYRVKAGDMIGFIADAFDITQDTIISVNNIKQSRLIQPGQYLKIPSMPGILYTVKIDGETPETVAEKYKIDAEKCALVNSVAINASLSAGSSLFVPDAALDWVTRQEINGDLFKNPLRARYWLSSPYGWRDSPFNSGSRSFHGGIDMAVASGTPIYAALEGTVTAAGYNATYGNYVIIQHHSGYKTLYGHMSAITCKKGNFVYTNTVIGKVGSTGLSTGPHLHFTVYKNGQTISPFSVLN
ncbi:MAG: M23 family metallopeptidase [Treponema sp.]|nr:M23 family metallopeptidase [Treponema sp.]